MIKLPKIAQTVIKRLEENHIKAIVVGGFVRDSLLALESKDIDLELYNLNDTSILKTILQDLGKVMEVGKSFGVTKFIHEECEIDLSCARLENKTGKGHRGFEVITHQKLSFEQAAKRRDFSINAIGYDPSTNTFLDPYHGLEDLKKHSLRVVDENTFQEDPLRILRALGFCARFNLKLEEKSFILCQEMVRAGMLEELAPERIFEEFQKVFLKAKKPSLAFKLLFALKMHLFHFQELQLSEKEQLILFKHLDFIAEKGFHNSAYMLSILCAPLQNKPLFLSKLTQDKKLIKEVLSLSSNLQSLKNGFQKAESYFLKLSTKACLQDLINLEQNDDYKNYALGIAQQHTILTAPPAPLLQGRDLIRLGFKPSKHFKEILELAYEKQLQRELLNQQEALVFAQSFLD